MTSVRVAFYPGDKNGEDDDRDRADDTGESMAHYAKFSTTRRAGLKVSRSCQLLFATARLLLFVMMLLMSLRVDRARDAYIACLATLCDARLM